MAGTLLQDYGMYCKQVAIMIMLNKTCRVIAFHNFLKLKQY